MTYDAARSHRPFWSLPRRSVTDAGLKERGKNIFGRAIATYRNRATLWSPNPAVKRRHMNASTSYRISERARQLLAARATEEQASATSVLERLIIEGIAAWEHPGIVFRGPPADRRAALAGGPDLWEVVMGLRGLDGTEAQRVVDLCAETDLTARGIRVALDYAAEHAEEIRARIARHEEAVERSQRQAAARRALLA